jgi:ATP-binding cassette subfamily F protein uup
VCDNVYALAEAGGIRHLPGGIDQYLSEFDQAGRTGPAPGAPAPGAAPGPARPAGAQLRATRKEVQRLERELDRQAERERALQAEMAAHATDHAKLGVLTQELGAAVAERERLEAAWMLAAESLEG